MPGYADLPMLLPSHSAGLVAGAVAVAAVEVAGACQETVLRLAVVVLLRW